MNTENEQPLYLGDGVYVEWDGAYFLELSTGLNKIYLEDTVFIELAKYGMRKFGIKKIEVEVGEK